MAFIMCEEENCVSCIFNVKRFRPVSVLAQNEDLKYNWVIHAELSDREVILYQVYGLR